MQRNVARGALLGIAGQVWHLITAFLLYAFLARQLGPALFGQWRVALSVLNWFEILLYSGLIKVTTKALAEAPEDRPRLVRASYLGQSVVAMVVFVALLVLAGPIAGALSDPRLATLLRISALDIPIYAIFMTSSAMLLGMHRFERQSFAWTVYATAKFVAIGALVLFGFSVPGALIGNALASLVGFAAAFTPLPKGSPRTPVSELWPLVGTLMVASIPFLALSMVEGIGTSADLWLVSAIVANAVAVGWYASASVLAEIPVFLFTALERIIFPSVSGAQADGDTKLAGHYATQAVRMGVIVTTLAVAAIAATGRQALELVYSAAYLGAYVPLVILMAAALGRTVRAICTEILMARDQRRTAITILVTTVALELVLLAAFATRWSLNGAAAATAISAGVAAVWAAVSLRDMLGLRPLYTFGRSACAAAVVGVVLYFITPRLAPFLSAPVLAVVGYAAVLLLAGIAYLGLLALLGEFDADDIASVRSVFQRERREPAQ